VEYREHHPSPGLASVVQCLWTLEGDADELGADVQPVLPDGRPELILHFGDAFERVHSMGTERQPLVLFAGQLTQRLELRATGRIAVLGVRFHPDGAAALVDSPQNELAGLTIGVDNLSAGICRSLSDVRESAQSLARAVESVQGCLVDHVDRARIDARVRHVVETIRRHRGRVRVNDLAARVGLTRRHLERRFNAVVGLSPKRLARIERFQHALRLLEDPESSENGACTAAMSGYADQAHFAREFRELAGCPPGAHLLRRPELSGFFSSG
jgi:AraC-like DNA-binding protein